MTETIMKCLPAALSVLAALIAAAMVAPLIRKRKAAGPEKSPSGEEVSEEPAAVRAEIPSRDFREPSPEELEEVVYCVDSPESSAMDEGPSLIERAVSGEDCGGERRRLSLAELVRAGMTVQDEAGKVMTGEQLLSGTDNVRSAERPDGIIREERPRLANEKGRDAYGR